MTNLETFISMSSSNLLRKPSKELKVLSKLSKSKYQLFVATSKIHEKKFAMKLFPFVENEIDPAFLREAYMSSIPSHKNIVSILEVEPRKETMLGTKHTYTSFVLTELSSFGDFSNLLLQNKLPKNEKLSRTFFHHLVEGMEHLHSHGAAHLDLKLENLLLGDDFQLKITDFDTAVSKDHPNIVSRGTSNFRAYELKSNRFCDPYKADVYSMGIILFVLQNRIMPYLENAQLKGIDLYELIRNEDSSFWSAITTINKSLKFDRDFKDLFFSMVKSDPSKRASLKEIKESNWYNKEIYSEEELRVLMKEALKED